VTHSSLACNHRRRHACKGRGDQQGCGVRSVLVQALSCMREKHGAACPLWMKTTQWHFPQLWPVTTHVVLHLHQPAQVVPCSQAGQRVCQAAAVCCSGLGHGATRFRQQGVLSLCPLTASYSSLPHEWCTKLGPVRGCPAPLPAPQRQQQEAHRAAAPYQLPSETTGSKETHRAAVVANIVPQQHSLSWSAAFPPACRVCSQQARVLLAGG
jgi:hypothetical protein